MSLSQVIEKVLGPLYNEDEVEGRFQLKLIQAQSIIAEEKAVPLFKIPVELSDKEEVLRHFRFYHPYLEQRRITKEVADIYDIGFDAVNNHITFPIRDINKNCIGIGRRSIDKKKYSYPYSLVKPLYGVFELPRKLNYLFVVEGPFNLWSLKVWGKTGVALLGTGTEHQINQLLKLPCYTYVLALDPDTAGRHGTLKIGKALLNARKTVYVTLIPEGKDVNDLTQEEFSHVNVVTFKYWCEKYAE